MFFFKNLLILDKKKNLKQKMFGYIIQSLAYNFVILFILFILSPCYILLASGMGKIYLHFHQYLQGRGTYFYKYLGDVSWLFPFKVKINWNYFIFNFHDNFRVKVISKL